MLVGHAIASHRALAWHGALLVVATAASASLYDGGAMHIADSHVMIFVGIQTGAGFVWLDAIRRRGEATLTLVLIVFALTRLIALAMPVFLSSDLARYVWDGRVQLAGINPYRYVPADDALAFLRDDAVYPFINRAATAHTIYPPAAQLIFALIAWISPTVIAMRIAMVAAETIAVAALALVLRGTGRPPEEALVYAWLPLGVWEFAGNGHCDALVVMFTALALLALSRPTLAGAALACATLVKFIPAVLIPALWRRGDRRFPAAFAATIVVLYAVYASAGPRVLGFLSGYAREEALGDSGFWPVALARTIVPAGWPALSAYVVVAGAILAALALRAWRPGPTTPKQAARAACMLALAAMLIITPHYPWYFPWIAVPATLAPLWPALLLLALSPMLYLDPWHEQVMWRALVYTPPLGLAAIEALRATPLGHARHPKEPATETAP